jgi:hypothetical protein
MAMGYGLDGQGTGVLFPTGAIDLPALKLTQPPIQWAPRAFTLDAKRLEHDANHSPPSSSEVNNGGAVLPLPHISSWLAAQLIRHERLYF